MDFAFGEPQTVGEFLLVAALEILLLSFGILLALRINNWNETRKESKQTGDLLTLLVKDLRENLDELVTDIKTGNRFNGMCENVFQLKDNIEQIEDEDLEEVLGFLAADHFFFAQSPAFARLSASNIWEKIPEELNSKIHHIYYGRIGIIQQRFAKHVEYATHCKITYLMPNNLFDSTLEPTQKKSIISATLDEFLLHTHLLNHSCARMVEFWERTTELINEAIRDIEALNHTTQATAHGIGSSGVESLEAHADATDSEEE